MLSFYRSALVVLAALAMAGAQPALAAEHAAKLDQALRQLKSGGPQRVIIRTNGRRAAIRQALEAHGDRVEAEHPSIDALTAEVHADDLRALAARDDVASIAVDAEVTPTAATRVKAQRRTQHRSSVLRATLGLTSASPTGLGIGVAVIDSGISPLPAFEGRITAFYDFTEGDIRATAPVDEYGHGTHVAGLIGAHDALGDDRYQGVAPAVRLVGLRVLDRKGRGLTSNVIRAIEFVTANRRALGVHIVNLSLGHPVLAPAADDPLVQAVEQAVRAGLIVVVSAGNFGTNPLTDEIGYAGITSPGNAPSAITVGAVDTKQSVTRDDDRVTAYSSRGPTWYDAFAKPDVVAPGHALISPVDGDCYLYQTYQALRREGRGSRRYIALSGTSMATGVVSGVVAALLEANGSAHAPNRLSANIVKGLLQYTALTARATDGDDVADPLTQGAGEVNADGAIRLASLLDAGAPANATWLNLRHPLAAPYSSIGEVTYPWASMILWGDNILWGESIAVNTMAWDDNIVWGMDDNIVWGMSTSWGDNIVWSMDDDNIVWGENIVWGDGLLTSIDGSNIVWSLLVNGDNIVWGQLLDDNIVWGMDDDNIVWGMGTTRNGGNPLFAEGR